MANLAIRGHETRGEEVIRILEMFGTCNPEGYVGSGDWYYCIADNEIIRVYYWNNFTVFTLEEFLEKYPFKVGDFVSIPEYESEVRICKMRWDPTCQNVEYLVYRCDEEVWYSAQELKEYNADFLSIKACGEPYKEETTEEKGTLVEIDLTRELCIADEVEVILGDYEFVLKDGKTYFVKKNKYPKTFGECCKVLSWDGGATVIGYDAEIIENFQKLLLCRNAYWKIAGDEMGLGKPWEPDWVNVEQDKYVLFTNNNAICSNCYVLGHNILAFPTEEMRNTFFENFKDLIEKCKELL